MYAFPGAEARDFIPLRFKILCRKQQLRPQNWVLPSSSIFKSVFPTTSPSFGQYKCAQKSRLLKSLSSEKSLRILRKQKLLPSFGSGFRHAIQSLNLSQVSPYPKNYPHLVFLNIPSSSVECLNTIFKEAKNLKSLVLVPECGESNFKGIQKARGLENLEINMSTRYISTYPGLFKGLTSLQKVTISLEFPRNKIDLLAISKFFGFLLNLPKLRHLTICLENSGNFFKAFLYAIHQKKLPSFLIIVLDASFNREPLQSLPMNWGDWIDALYVGQINSFTSQKQYWPPSEKPERRLMLNLPFCLNSRLDDLVNGSITIKTLDIVDLYSNLQSTSVENAENLFCLISRTKTLENLTLSHQTSFWDYRQVMRDFHKQFSQIESLENLKNFTFKLQNRTDYFPAVPPPYSSKMKNLKALSLKIAACYFYLNDFTEALRELATLENFEFRYTEFIPYADRGKVDCNFPFEKLRNLKSIRLYCDLPFVSSCINQLFRGLVQLDKLEALEISGEILQGLDRKRASGFTEGLCAKKSLEIASFEWREAVGCRWSVVRMNRVHGEMVISSEHRR